MNPKSRRFGAPLILAPLALTLSTTTLAQEAPAPVAAPDGTTATPPEATKPAPREALAIEEELAQFTASGALTADEVARRSIEQSARLEAKREAVRGVEAQREATLARFYPKLTGTARYTRLSEITMPPFGATPPGVNPVYATTEGPVTAATQLFSAASPGTTFPVFLNNWEFKASLAIPLSDYVFRLSTALTGAGKLRQSAEANEKAERLIIQTEARVAYYNWVKALGAEYVAEKSSAQVKSSLEDTKRAFSLGTVSKADVLRLESALQRSELMKTRAHHMVELSAEQLRLLMNDGPGVSYRVGEPMLEDVEMPDVASMEGALHEAREKRLEIRALRAVEESYEEGATLSKIDGLPRLDAQGNLFTANPNPRMFPPSEVFTPGWDVSLVLTWTPTDIPGAMANATVNSSKAAEYRAQRKALEDAMRVEVAQAVHEAENAKFAVSTAEEVLRSAEEGYRVRRELYRVGRATTLELNDAETSLAQARLDLVFSKMDAKIARARLLHVLGRDTEGGAKSSDSKAVN